MYEIYRYDCKCLIYNETFLDIFCIKTFIINEKCNIFVSLKRQYIQSLSEKWYFHKETRISHTGLMTFGIYNGIVWSNTRLLVSGFTTPSL